MARSKSKGNFLSGGESVCVCGGGGGEMSLCPSSGLPTAGVCTIMCVVTAPPYSVI